MMSGDGAPARRAGRLDDATEAAANRSAGTSMPLQSYRGYEAAPQTFIRLVGCRLGKPVDGPSLSPSIAPDIAPAEA